VEEPFRTLLWAATRAPSGDNTQPWRFVVQPEERRIAIYVDEARDTSPMNAGQGMSRIAVGAALENLLRVAESMGYDVDLESPRNGAAASVRISGEGTEGEIDPCITERVTNRRRYDGRPVPPEVIAELQRKTPDLERVRTHWIHDRHRLLALAALIGQADRLMLGEPSMRRAFLDNVRFDVPENTEVEEGLPVASLELPAPQRLALRVLPKIPDWLLKATGATRQFASAARRLVASASGLCVVTQEGGCPERDVIAGRAIQRAWLAMTRRGLAAQPMMSLAILENLQLHAVTEPMVRIGPKRITRVLAQFRALVPETGDERIAFIMRFGSAPPPTGRAERFRLERVSEVVRVPTARQRSGAPLPPCKQPIEQAAPAPADG